MRMLEVTPPRPGHLCPPRHVPVPPTLARDRDSSDRCSPCPVLVPLQGDTGGAQGAAPPLDSTHLFYVFFFYVFPFSSFPPPRFSLAPPPPPLSLSLSSLHFSKVSQPCPPRGGLQDGDPPQLMCVCPRMGTLPQDGDTPLLACPPLPPDTGVVGAASTRGGASGWGAGRGVLGDTHTQGVPCPQKRSQLLMLSPPPRSS